VIAPSVNDYKGNCQKCLRAVLGTRGTYCANAWSKRGHFPRCDGIWHGPCFTVGDSVEFPIRLPMDEEGYRIVKTKDKGRFESGRNGDHLITEFQPVVSLLKCVWPKS
jgi:hypothetical protein